MNSNRDIAILVGVLYILAAVTAIIGFTLYQPILTDPDYIVNGSANGTQILWGAFNELILAFSVIGIGVMMFPVVNKENETIAIGYVCFRLLEAIIIIVGIISLISVVTLSQEFEKAVAPNVSSYLTAGKLLVTIHNWTFLLGPNLALGPSTLMMSYFLYESKLVPGYISVLGIIGGSLILVCALLVMFGVFLQVSVWGVILAIPVFAYEMSLAVWLIAKGFNSSAVYSAISLKQ
ncbi:MAG: DUF4386 domain-containing protein [Bacteroidota bacterium]